MILLRRYDYKLPAKPLYTDLKWVVMTVTARYRVIGTAGPSTPLLRSSGRDYRGRAVTSRKVSDLDGRNREQLLRRDLRSFTGGVRLPFAALRRHRLSCPGGRRRRRARGALEGSWGQS